MRQSDRPEVSAAARTHGRALLIGTVSVHLLPIPFSILAFLLSCMYLRDLLLSVAISPMWTPWMDNWY